MKNQRRRYFIDRDMQGGIAWRLTVNWLCSILIVLLMMLFAQFVFDPQALFATQFGRAITTVLPVVAALVLLLPVVLRDMILFTNRFAGPLFSLKRAMCALRKGEFQGELRFRENDYWQDLAKEFNLLARQVEAWRKQEQRTEDSQPVSAAGAVT